MLSVLIETENDEEALARTLGSLVGAAVDGVVREVIVCDHGSSDQTHYVAEHAGCIFLAAGGLPAAIARAKGDWLLFLDPGARLVDGWTAPALRHIGTHATPACFTPMRKGRMSLLARIFSARRPLADGLLIARKQAANRPGDAAMIARGLRTKRLDAEIWIAPLK